MSNPNKPRLWVLSELYYPEDSATGYYVTGVAEGLANAFDVRVLCAQPTYAARGTKAPKEECYQNVCIHRCAATALNKDILLFRVVNLVTISLSIFLSALARVRTGDQVFVVTNPPTLPFLALLVCKFRRARLILRVEDVYPEAMVAAGILRLGSPFYRFLQAAHRRLLMAADIIVVLGRDMKRLVEAKAPARSENVCIIPNWADLEQIHPLDRRDNPLLHRLGLTEKFVVQYSGNMGRTHDLESLLEVASLLQDHALIHFLLIGTGAKESAVRRTVEARRLTNVSILPPQKRSDLRISLNACDLAVIAFVPRMVGVSVPSRMYNVLAAGKPILAVAGKDSELAMLVRETEVGWVVEPGDREGIHRTLLEACSRRDLLARFSANARTVVEKNYSYASIVEKYFALLNSHLSESRGAA